MKTLLIIVSFAVSTTAFASPVEKIHNYTCRFRSGGSINMECSMNVDLSMSAGEMNFKQQIGDCPYSVSVSKSAGDVEIAVELSRRNQSVGFASTFIRDFPDEFVLNTMDNIDDESNAPVVIQAWCRRK